MKGSLPKPVTVQCKKQENALIVIPATSYQVMEELELFQMGN